jgi:predicted RNase H-like nuclease (RuvC/YqgF family)
MPRRRRAASPFSLFAFQDIITAVTGVMVLVTLFLALELVQRKEEAPPRKTREITQDLRAQMVQSQAETGELEDRQAELTAMLKELAAYDAAAVRSEIRDLQAVNKKLQQENDERARQRDEANRRQEQAEAEQARIEQGRQKLKQTLETARQRERQLAKLKQSKRLFFNVKEGAGKQAWLTELAEAGLTVAQVGQLAQPRQFANTDAFLAWAKERDRKSEYFVLLVKPSGIKRYAEVYPALRQELKFDIGFDLLTEDQSAIDPETGANP